MVVRNASSRTVIRERADPRVELELRDSVLPVFLGTAVPDRTRPIGSAVFVEVEKEHYLWTAAHVIDQSDDEHHLLVPTRNGIAGIEGFESHLRVPAGFRREQDYLDLAYIRLEPEFAQSLMVHFVPVPESRLEIVGERFGPRSCAIVGYPGSRSKEHRGRVASEQSVYYGVGDWPRIVEESGLNPELAIVVHFRKENAVHPQTLAPVAVAGMKGVAAIPGRNCPYTQGPRRCDHRNP